jgi:hypothetical protein
MFSVLRKFLQFNEDRNNQSNCQIWYYFVLRTIIISSFFFLHKAFSIDNIEAFYWGQELMWVYPKHPPLFAWMSELWFNLVMGNLFLYHSCSTFLTSGGIVASFYLFSYLTGNKKISFLAAVFIDGATFYNWAHQGLNANTILYPIWPLICLFYLKAIEKNKTKNWLLFGLMSGLGVLGKYNSVLITFFCAIFTLYNKKDKEKLLTINPYLSLIPFFILVAPHFYFVFEAGGSSISYIVNNSPRSDAGLFFKLQEFGLWSGSVLILNCLPMLIAIFLMIVRVSKKNENELLNGDLFKNKSLKLFCNLVVYGSLFFWLLYSLLLCKPRTAWFSPHYFIISLFFLQFVYNKIIKSRQKYALFFIFFVTIVSSFLGELMSSSFMNDGREERRGLTEELITKWKNLYGECPRYTTYKDVTIYGRVICGHKIHMILTDKIEQNPWKIDTNDMLKSGVLVVNEDDKRSVVDLIKLFGKARYEDKVICKKNKIDGRSKCETRIIQFYHQ